MSHVPQVLQAFSQLLSYPDERTVPTVEYLYVVLQGEFPAAAESASQFGTFVEQHELWEVEEAFTRTFDVNPACALEVGWHLFGEEYARGMFLVRIRQELRKYDLPESVELPDHVSHVLAVVAAMPDKEATRFVQACVQPAVEKMNRALEGQETPFRHVVAGLASVLRQCWGETASSIPAKAHDARSPGADPLHAFPVADAGCGTGCGPCGDDPVPLDINPSVTCQRTRLDAKPDEEIMIAKLLEQLSLAPFWFVALPYVCLFTFFLMTVYRYRMQSFSYSSLSSQFLENKHHFWSVVPFHYGILVVTAGHFVAFLIPRTILAWNSRPLRLYVLEVSALAFGMLTVIGLVGILLRRFSNSKIRTVTTLTDWILFAMLFMQTVSGVSVAIFYPWGSSWFATNLSPYLWSIFKLSPNIDYVTAMPLLVKFHIVMAFLTIGFFPFTRLVHVLVIPNPYLWRKPQVVRWYGQRPRAADQQPRSRAEIA